VRTLSFAYDLELERSMIFEPAYHEALQLALSQKRKIRDVPGSIFAWMFVGGQLAGESYGMPLSSSYEHQGLSELSQAEKESGMYCYSNTVLSHFQRQGLGAILKAHWLGLVAGAGYDIVYGHARPGPSQALNAKFGAVFLAAFPDWATTGEEYKLYRLELR
jgi:hypothetical protein